MDRADAMLVALENRAFLYDFAWRLLAAPMDAQALAWVGDTEVERQVALIDGETGRLKDIQRRLAEAAAEATVDALAADFTRLFEGPGKLPAPPWESVYRGDGDLLFQESTLAVREAYREAGFKAAAYPREADDHVATELSFMAALVRGAADAVRLDNAERSRAFLIAQGKFLGDHLNTWLRPFAERLNEWAPGGTAPFYPLAAYFVAELAALDAGVVEELLNEIS